MNYLGFIKRTLIALLVTLGLGTFGALFQPQSAYAAANVTFLKSANKSIINDGETVIYTITVSNSGDTAATGITVDDNLSDILDDAAYNGDIAVSGQGSVSYSSPTVSWTGDLDVGQTASITFSVTLNSPDTGNALLTNKLVSNQGNCQSGSTDLRCSETVNVSRVAFTKVADTNTFTPGSTVHYTITITSNGTADVGSVELTDDLSQVLDDATYENDAQLTGPGGIGYSSPTLTYNVPSLSVGQTATITYSVVVGNPSSGDQNLTNTLVSDQGNCKQGSTDTACTVEIGETSSGSSNIQLNKSVSTTSTNEGSQVTYTITAVNNGTAAGDATFTDNLSGVLDDATLSAITQATGPIVGQYTSATQTYTFNVTSLAPTDEATFIYTVTVNTPDTGNRLLSNVLQGLNCTSAAVAGCSTSTTVAPLAQTTPVTIKKTVSSQQTQAGEVLTYTITAYNDDDPPHQITITDDLTDILDDATYNNDASSPDGTVAYSQPALTWTVNLTSIQTATLTYTVTVKPSGSGNRTMTSTVSEAGALTNCPVGATDEDCTATTTVALGNNVSNPPVVTTASTSTNTGTNSNNDLAKTGQDTMVILFTSISALSMGVATILYRRTIR